MRRVLLVIVGCCFALGCSGGGDSTTPGGAVPIDQLARQVGVTFCDELVHCGVADEDYNIVRVILRDQGRCETYLDQVYRSRSPEFNDVAIADLTTLVARGRIRYDASQARACLNAVASTCTDLDDHAQRIAPCATVFQGTVAIGGACGESAECAGDAYCDRTDTCGTCRARVAIGAACDDDFQCSPVGLTGGVDCHSPPDTGMYTCVEVRQGTNAAAGQPCGESVTGTVLTLTRCAAGLWCSDKSAGSCREPIAEGQPCSHDDVCVDGALCDAAETCRDVTIQSTAGASCGLEACDPLARLECNGDTMTCALVGDGSLGSVCNGGDFPIGCNAGLVCIDETCQMPHADGGMCTSDDDCSSGRCTMDHCAQPPSCG